VEISSTLSRAASVVENGNYLLGALTEDNKFSLLFVTVEFFDTPLGGFNVLNHVHPN